MTTGGKSFTETMMPGDGAPESSAQCAHGGGVTDIAKVVARMPTARTMATQSSLRFGTE